MGIIQRCSRGSSGELMYKFAALCGTLVFLTLGAGYAQQQTSSEQTPEKKSGKHEQTAKALEKEESPREPAEKRVENPENAPANDKQPANDEHWDVSEAAPVVTRHQITVN